VFSPVHYCTPYVKRNKGDEIYLWVTFIYTKNGSFCG
jgi:hypothetical protein